MDNVRAKLNSLLVKLGFKKPKNKKEEIKVLKEVKEAVEEKIEHLEEKQLKGELSAVSNLKSKGAFDYTIENKNGVKNLKELLDKCEASQDEVVKKHLICKVAYSYYLELFRQSDGRDDRVFEKEFYTRCCYCSVSGMDLRGVSGSKGENAEQGE